MSGSASKRKRGTAAAAAEQSSATCQSTVINGLLDCYDFITKNEYSEETIGIQAFLIRKAVGDINFSDLIDEGEKRSRQGQSVDFRVLLDERRKALQEIDASIEKCLMITRLITFLDQNQANFTAMLSNIRMNMLTRLNDNQNNRNIQFPADFVRREQEFNARRLAQERRRLFYFSQKELHPLQNLVALQNRTTAHLRYVIDQIASNPKSSEPWLKELEKIVHQSFMIVAHPHSGVNPTTIYERKGPGQYGAKISVCIISLLHDFIQQNPKLIQLYDIEPSLCPTMEYYKLEEPRSIPWTACQLQTASDDKTRTFLHANLNYITIEQASKSDTRVRFAQELHTFKFAIKLQFNLAHSKMPPIYQLTLESLPFAIGAHNNQISQLLTRVIFDDVRRFTRSPMVDVKTIHQYLQRYYIHRTGVNMNSCVSTYLEQELLKASGRGHYQRSDEMYMDFVVHFVHQVEFMAKHPILAMFHADGLFLGICSSERAAEAIVQACTTGSPAIGLRFNSIRVDYATTAASTASGSKTVKTNPCAVRVDIYNNRTKKLQNRTFDSSCLPNDIGKFVAASHTGNADHILLLSSFDDKSNSRTTLPFSAFKMYFHDRLLEISKTDEKYKPVTDLVENAVNGNTEENDPEFATDDASSIYRLGQDSDHPPFSVTDSLFEGALDDPNSHDYVSIPDQNSQQMLSSLQSVASPPNQIPPQPLQYANQQDLLKVILSQPDTLQELFRQMGVINIASPIVAPSNQQQQQQTQQPQLIQYPYQPSAPYAMQQQVIYQQPAQRQMPGNYATAPAAVRLAPQQQAHQRGAAPFQQVDPQMQYRYQMMTQMQQQQSVMPQVQQVIMPQMQQQPMRGSTVNHYASSIYPAQGPLLQPSPNLVQTVNNIELTAQRFSNQVESSPINVDNLDFPTLIDFPDILNGPNLVTEDDLVDALFGPQPSNQETSDARPFG